MIKQEIGLAVAGLHIIKLKGRSASYTFSFTGLGKIVIA